jgi:hypothetical protein
MYSNQPYGPPPQPPSSGTNVGLIVGLVCAAVVLVILGVAVVAGVYVGYTTARSRAKHSAPHAATSASPFAQAYPMKNGLAIAHYPSDFAAKSIDDASLLVSRVLPDGHDEDIEIVAVGTPISDDVNEFSRVLVLAMKKNVEKSGDVWTETSRHSGPCFRGHVGVAIEGTFIAQKLIEEHVRACYFIDAGHGYEMKTIVPAIHDAAELPLLQSMLDATELE